MASFLSLFQKAAVSLLYMHSIPLLPQALRLLPPAAREVACGIPYDARVFRAAVSCLLNNFPRPVWFLLFRAFSAMVRTVFEASIMGSIAVSFAGDGAFLRSAVHNKDEKR